MIALKGNQRGQHVRSAFVTLPRDVRDRLLKRVQEKAGALASKVLLVKQPNGESGLDGAIPQRRGDNARRDGEVSTGGIA